MFRTIVVGHDGSAQADDAVALALQLREPEGRLVLTRTLLAAVGDTHARAMRSLRRIAGRLPEDVPVELEVYDGTTAAAGLATIAAARDADLITLGWTHHGAPGRVTGRAAANRLLHDAPCAVAVAAPHQDRRPVACPRLLVGYDGSTEADVALATAYDIAAARSGCVILCQVIPPVPHANDVVTAAEVLASYAPLEEEARRNLDDAAARAPEGVEVQRRVLHGSAAWRLLDSTRSEVDLLVCGSRHRGALWRAIGGSVAATLLAHGHVPMLITPRRAAAREAVELSAR